MTTLHMFTSQLTWRTVTTAIATALLVSGCSDSSQTGGAAPSSPQAKVPEDGLDHEHAHPTEGPHHGDLVELGHDEYHAEIVHGDGGEVSVYILDSDASKAVPIDATELTINMSHEGEAEVFKLPAAPDVGESEGKVSRFTLQDEHLAEDLDAEGTSAKLVVTINGKSYSGKIEHSHEHEGHDHEH